MDRITAYSTLTVPEDCDAPFVLKTLALAREWQFRQAHEGLRAALKADDSVTRSLMEALDCAVRWYERAAQGDLSEGLEEALTAILRLRAAGFAQPAAWLTSSAGYCMGMQGDLEASLQWVEEALVEGQPLHDAPWFGRLWNNKAALHFMAGEMDEAMAAYAQALKHCEPDVIPARAVILNSLAYVNLRKALRLPAEDPDRLACARAAQEHVDAVLQDVDLTAQETGLQGWAMSTRGAALHLMGHLGQARRTLEQALSHIDSNVRVKVTLLSHLGRLLTDLGEHDEARALLDEAFSLAPTGLMDDALDLVLEVRLRLEMARGDQGATLVWSNRKMQRLEEQYRGRLASFRKHAALLTRTEREREEERRQARLQIEQSRAAERDLLLRDMHDGFGSQLASAKVLIDEGTLSPAEISELLQECLTDLSMIADTLGQDDLSLENALSDLRYRMGKRLGGGTVTLHWEVEQAGQARRLLPREILQVLRIVQEALHNAWRHSHGRNVWVVLKVEDDGAFDLVISDDGVGWPPDVNAGRGLGNMRSRAHLLGASLMFESQEGPGARVVLRMPSTRA